MADQKLSALTELATTPASDDEVYIRDESEPASTESKRITIANLQALLLQLTGGTLTGNLIIEKADPMLLLKATEASSKEWQIKEIVFSNKSWVWIYNSTDDKGLYLREDGVLENQKFHAIVDTGAGSANWPHLLLECTGAELAFWQITNDGLDLRFESTKAGALLLGMGVRIKVNSFTGADHTCSGESTGDITAGENLVYGDAVYIKSDGKAWKSDADGTATMPIFGIAIATINAEASGEILTRGWIRDDSWSLTVGGIVYASITPGAMSTTAPVGSGDQVQVVGVAITATIIHFNPSYVLEEIP